MKIKKIIKYGIICMIVLLCIVLGINFFVVKTTQNQIITSDKINDLKDIDCILVLGAGIWGDKPSPMLEDRLNEAISLYKENVSAKIIMSGDHGREDYDEVNIMKEYAIEKGVPSESIFMDHAGFSSYESIYRLREIFEAKKVVIVTQKYHLFRALYIANQFDLEAYGVNSDPRRYVGAAYRELREVLARNKDFIQCIIKPKPTYLGETIPVSGNGDITNDKENAVQENEIKDLKSVSGIIEKIENNKLSVYYDGKVYEIDYSEEFINMRTREKISLDEIKQYDYYSSSGEIARNLSGDELKEELLKNMSVAFSSGPLYANPKEIKNIENKGEYVILDVVIEDVLSDKLGRELPATVEVQFIANKETNIPTVQKVELENLKEETNGFMFWLELQEDSLKDKYPVIKTIEIYDK